MLSNDLLQYLNSLSSCIDYFSPEKILSHEDQQKLEKVIAKLKERYEVYRDPWGFDIETVITTLKILLPFYRYYFNVRVFGIENIPNSQVIVVPNHSGQIPIDGALITMAMAWECADNPRVLHSMVDRFVMNLPFLADFYGQTGAILGDRENCAYLLNKNESILAFPEGVRGVSKSTSDFYQLQKFSDGFYRIALNKKVPILPVAVVGAEEMFPFVWHFKSLKKFFASTFHIPPVPLSLNYVPLPSPIDIHFLPPVQISENLSADDSDKLIRVEIEKIEQQIRDKIQEGLKIKRGLRDQLLFWREKLS